MLAPVPQSMYPSWFAQHISQHNSDVRGSYNRIACNELVQDQTMLHKHLDLFQKRDCDIENSAVSRSIPESYCYKHKEILTSRRQALKCTTCKLCNRPVITRYRREPDIEDVREIIGSCRQSQLRLLSSRAFRHSGKLGGSAD